MNILGICNANVSGAALLIDGEVAACVNEERFSRIKNDRAFPVQSVDYCLKYAGLKRSDIDYVPCGGWGGLDETFLPQLVGELMETALADPAAIPQIKDRTRVSVERDHQARAENTEAILGLGFRRDQINYFDHHLSHAYTAVLSFAI